MEKRAREWPKGWLMRDLRAAVREVLTWPEGMRRGVSKSELRKLLRTLAAQKKEMGT